LRTTTMATKAGKTAPPITLQGLLYLKFASVGFTHPTG